MKNKQIMNSIYDFLENNMDIISDEDFSMTLTNKDNIIIKLDNEEEIYTISIRNNKDNNSILDMYEEVELYINNKEDKDFIELTDEQIGEAARVIADKILTDTQFNNEIDSAIDYYIKEYFNK